MVKSTAALVVTDCSLYLPVHLRVQRNSRYKAEALDLGQWQKLLVVALGDINHQLLRALWELS